MSVRGSIDARLVELGLELPEPSAPGANYVPFVRRGNLVFVTGQLSQWNGERRFIGKLGREFDVEEGLVFLAAAVDEQCPAPSSIGLKVASVVKASSRPRIKTRPDILAWGGRADSP